MKPDTITIAGIPVCKYCNYFMIDEHPDKDKGRCFHPYKAILEDAKHSSVIRTLTDRPVVHERCNTCELFKEKSK